MADTQDEVATKSFEVEKPTKRLQLSSFRNLACNKCCFCVPLRTGCLILAYLYLVGTIMIGINSIWLLTYLLSRMSRFPKISHNTNIITFLVLHSVNFGLALPAIAFTVLLLIGLHKEKRSFVRLFVIFQLAYTILNVLQYIFVIVMGYTTAASIVIGLVRQVLNIYCTLVMWSQYLKMGATVRSEPVGRFYTDGHLVMTP